MNESIKTLIFVVAAVAVVAVAAVVSRPVAETYNAASIVGQELFPDMTDALAVASLEIIQYDEQKGEIVPFEVRQVNHRWVLPSHFSYPADAKDQVVKAATNLAGLRVISVVDESAASHAEYGVVTPEVSAMQIGSRGVGRRVVMKDERGRVLLDMIIGKDVGQGSGKRYVRRAGQDPVYTVELDTSQLSSDFSDWIEKDLMKIQPWDITSLDVMDYVLDPTAGPLSSGVVGLRYRDMEDTAWQLVSYRIPQGTGQMREVGMPAGRVLNEEKLDNCRNALAEMRIVDVARKPEGLSLQLKGQGDANFSEEAEQSLAEKGFYLVRMPGAGGGTEEVLLSTEGEIAVATQTGILYMLRFGNVAGAETKDADAPLSLNRYLFIMAELDTNSIPQATPVPVPEILADVSDVERAQMELARDAAVALNREMQEEYETNLAEAKTRAEMLNERFAQWYYVIPESVYQSIHLTADAIFIREADVKKHVHDEHCDHDHADGHVCGENCPHYGEKKPAVETPAVKGEDTPTAETPSEPPAVSEPSGEEPVAVEPVETPVVPEVPETEEAWPVYTPDAGMETPESGGPETGAVEENAPETKPAAEQVPATGEAASQDVPVTENVHENAPEGENLPEMEAATDAP